MAVITECPALQEQESLQDIIVDLAHEIHQKQDGPDLLVYIWFSRNTRLTMKDVKGVASNLAEIVVQSNLALGDELWIEGWSYAHQKLLRCPYSIDRIFIEYVREPAFSLWGVARGDAVPTLKPEQIEIKIKKKEEKIDSYRSHCESVWLVIVADGFAPSSHFELDDVIIRHVYHTRFDRVFYFHNFTGTIVELMTDS